MKTGFKIIIAGVLIFVLSALGITYFYISSHLHSDLSEIQVHSIINIFIELGLLGALIPALLFVSLYLLTHKVNNKVMLSLAIVMISALAVILTIRFIMYMTFHEFSPMIQFQPI